MKKSLAAAAAIIVAGTVAASAADMNVKAPMFSPAAISNWSGFYVGGHAGAGWGTTETTLDSLVAAGAPPVAAGLAFSQNSRSGFLGGGQVGYNFQSGWAVFGVQADIAALDVKGTTPCLQVLSCTAKSNWLGTVSGRIGGVVADKTLVYAKGGAAWLNSNHTLNASVLGGLGGVGIGSVSTESTTLGWLFGMGAEYAFTSNWSAFIEYNYIGFDKKSTALDLTSLVGTAATANVSIQNKLSIAKTGVNYKF